ncbi:MAG: hypothetical protein LC121_16060 [Anaerolineae bacterium]|nr:hypothetical protein [Anaerolineae bacterium]
MSVRRIAVAALLASALGQALGQPVARPVAPFGQTLSLQGVTFRVDCPNDSSLGLAHIAVVRAGIERTVIRSAAPSSAVVTAIPVSGCGCSTRFGYRILQVDYDTDGYVYDM